MTTFSSSSTVNRRAVDRVRLWRRVRQQRRWAWLRRLGALLRGR